MAIWESSHFSFYELQELLKACETLEKYGLEDEDMLRELRDYIREREEEAY